MLCGCEYFSEITLLYFVYKKIKRYSHYRMKIDYNFFNGKRC